MNAQVPQKIEIDEESAALLAKMDARGVDEGKLMVVFRCSAEELGMCREAESYKEAFAAETLAIEQRAAQLDDTWDDIEAKASADLKEMLEVGAVADPRALLYTASTANKMARRSASQSADGLERKKAEAARPALNGNQQVVIRLRTRFVEQIDTPAGHQKLLEREAEIQASTPANVADEMGVAEVRNHLTNSLGIDLNELKSGGRLGPDTPLEEMLQAGGHTAYELPPDMFAPKPEDDD